MCKLSKNIVAQWEGKNYLPTLNLFSWTNRITEVKIMAMKEQKKTESKKPEKEEAGRNICSCSCGQKRK